MKKNDPLFIVLYFTVAAVVAFGVLRSCPRKTISALKPLALEMQSAHAAEGCGLSFQVFQHTWDDWLFQCGYSNWSGWHMLARYDTSWHGLSGGDEVYVARAQVECPTPAMTWGQTMFANGCVNPPQLSFQSMHVPADNWVTAYMAAMICDCPNNAHGFISIIGIQTCPGQ